MNKVFLILICQILLNGCSEKAIEIEDYPYSQAAIKPDELAGILYFRQERYDESKIYRIVRHDKNSEIEEYFEIKGQIHNRVRLLPGNYTIFYYGGSWEDELNVSIKAGHSYEVKQKSNHFVCGTEREFEVPVFLGCYLKGSIWIEDVTQRQIISSIGNYCSENHTAGLWPSFEVYNLISCDRSDVELSTLIVSNPETLSISRITRYEKKNNQINKYTEYTEFIKKYRVTESGVWSIRYKYSLLFYSWKEHVPGNYIIKYYIPTKTGTKIWEGKFDIVIEEGHSYKIKSDIESSIPERPYQYKVNTWVEDITEGKIVTEIISHCCTSFPLKNRNRYTPQ